MLKQSFNLEDISKIIRKSDVWKWSLWTNKSEQNKRLLEIEKRIKEKHKKINKFNEYFHKKKKTFQASNIEDVISIRLLDKYLRRIYKVKQSDRNKIILQIKNILSDNDDFKIIRLDIEKCYETIDFKKVISHLESDMILSPDNLNLLKSILRVCKTQKIKGLPRGIAISPTLTELFLEKIDIELKQQNGVIFIKRYVDDYFLVVETELADEIEKSISSKLKNIGLNINKTTGKYFISSTRATNFDYLGYNFTTIYTSGKPNIVSLKISDTKISKIKNKIALSFNDFRKNKNFELLRQRINYLASIRVIKRHDNGTLLGGIVYSYINVTDNFDALKKVDGFYIKMINNSRYDLTSSQKEELKKKSFYGFVNKKKRAVFTKKKSFLITRIWKNV